MDPDTLDPSERTRLRRGVARGRHDRATVHGILDAGLVCHVGFAVQGRPWVFPTAYARIDDHVLVHGARANFGLRTLAAGAEACVTVTILDGLVLSRSAFHHSMNYRSVMLFGRAEAVTDPDAKRAGLLAIVDHMVRGRAADTRPPSDEELRRTLLIRIPIVEASAKVRSGGPAEEESDIGLAHWAGHLPLTWAASEPIQDRSAPGDATLAVPGYVGIWALTPAAAVCGPA